MRDTDDPFANVAVNVGGCSGILISPTAVLTAAHCVVGAADRGGAADNRFVPVFIGNDMSSPKHPGHSSVGYVSKVFPGPTHPGADDGDDIALIFMDPTDATQFELANAYAFRPTFEVPTRVAPETIQKCGSGTVNAGYYANIGAAGWDDDTFRSAVLRTDSEQLGMATCESDPSVGGCYSYFFSNVWTNCRGDSGGPLFVMNPLSESATGATSTELSGHPFRDVVGTATTVGAGQPLGQCGPPTYVDITDPYDYGTCESDSDCTNGGVCTNKTCRTEPLAKWVDDHMKDGALSVSTAGSFQGHSGRWLTLHGKDSITLNGQSFWRGEVDYIGHCKNPFVTPADLDREGGAIATPDELQRCMDLHLDPATSDCDCDHWFDIHDNCLFAYNPDQKWTNEVLQVDPNGKPIGDTCKNCPCDLNNDSDGDGRCDVLCPWQVAEGKFVDNCPNVWNPDQANCNVDFELAHQQDAIPILGDACDPVPCPVPNAVQSLTASTGAPGCGSFSNTCTNPSPNSPICGPGCVLNNDPGCMTCQCCGLSNDNTVFTSTIGAHERTPPPPSKTAVEVDVPPGDTGVADTAMRFCQQNQASNILCGIPSVLNDQQLAQPEGPSTQGAPWHRIHMQGSGKVSTVVFDPHFTNWTYGVSSVTLDWVYLTDFNNWLGDPNNPVIPGCTTGTPPNAAASPFTCLNGTWWTSAKTDVGKLIDTVGVLTVGNHVPSTFDGNSPLSGSIADGIIPMRPASTTLWCPIPSPIIPISGSGKLYHGPLGFGAGKLVVLPHGSLSPQLDIGLGGDARFLVATSVGNVMAALQPDGSAIAAEDVGSANCGGAQVDDTIHLISFSGTSTWLSAIEPSTAIQGLDLDAVALAVDGTTIMGSARAGVGASPTGLPIPQLQGVLIDPATGGANDSQIPAPRDGYATAFSRWAGGIFVAGGVARSDGSTLHDVWFRGIAGRWTNVTPHAALGTSCPDCGIVRELGEIEAITFSFDDNKLWILDELPSSKFPRLRLSRAKPGGAIEQIAIWVKKPGLEEYDFLSLDHDGSVLVSRGKAVGQGFFTARVEVGADGTARAVSSFVDHDDKLLGPPFVSPVGYGFFVQHGQTPKIVRQRTLFPLEHNKEMGALGDP